MPKKIICVPIIIFNYTVAMKYQWPCQRNIAKELYHRGTLLGAHAGQNPLRGHPQREPVRGHSYCAATSLARENARAAGILIP
jgi:hypothetical protein